MVDHFYCDAATVEFLKWAAGIAVKGGPGFFVDFGFRVVLRLLYGSFDSRASQLSPKRQRGLVYGKGVTHLLDHV